LGGLLKNGLTQVFVIHAAGTCWLNSCYTWLIQWLYRRRLLYLF